MITVAIKYWQAVSTAANITGAALKVGYNNRVTAAFTWTGTPTGTLALQCRMAGGTWGDVPGASTEFTTQPAGAAQSTPVIGNWSNVPGDEYRFTFTGSGSGTITCNIAQGDLHVAGA